MIGIPPARGLHVRNTPAQGLLEWISTEGTTPCELLENTRTAFSHPCNSINPGADQSSMADPANDRVAVEECGT